MGNERWEPDVDMLERGWNFLELVPNSSLDDFVKKAEARFKEVETKDADYDDSERLYAVYVKGYEERTQIEKPGGNFVFLASTDKELDDEAKTKLADAFSVVNDGKSRSFLTTKEPVYGPSQVCAGEYEKTGERFTHWVR